MLAFPHLATTCYCLPGDFFFFYFTLLTVALNGSYARASSRKKKADNRETSLVWNRRANRWLCNVWSVLAVLARNTCFFIYIYIE